MVKMIFLSVAVFFVSITNGQGNYEGTWKLKLLSPANRRGGDYTLKLRYDIAKDLYYGIYSVDVPQKSKFPTIKNQKTAVVCSAANGGFTLVEVAFEQPQNDAVLTYGIPDGRLHSNTWALGYYNFNPVNEASFKGDLLVESFSSPATLEKINAEVTTSEKTQISEVFNALKIKNYRFDGGGGGQRIKENSGGYITFTIENTSNYVFYNIQADLNFINDKNRSVVGGMMGVEGANTVYFQQRMYPKANQMAVYAFSLNGPVDDDSLQIEIAFSNPKTTNRIIAFNQERHDVQVSKLITSKTINVNNESGNRMKVVNKIFGIGGYQYNIKNEIENLVKSGDKKAIIWRSFFQYFGIGGFEVDEMMATYYVRQNKNYESVLLDSKNGDAESIVLAYFLWNTRILSPPADKNLDEFLIKAADADYPIAIYMLGLKRIAQKKMNDARYLLDKSLNKGVQIASIPLAVNWAVKKEEIGNLTKLATEENSDALMFLYDYYTKDTTNPGNERAGAIYLLKASDLSTKGKIAYSNYLLKNPKKVQQAIKLKADAASAGNRDAIFELGLYKLYGNINNHKADSSGISDIKNAAELGQPEAMILLGVLYNEGKLIGKDEFLGRFWYNQGVSLNNTTQQGAKLSSNSFLSNFLNYKIQKHDEMIQDFKAFIDSNSFQKKLVAFINWGPIGVDILRLRRQRQVIQNELRVIYTRNQISIYGGIISSSLKLPFTLEPGKSIDVFAEGIITVGVLTGTTDPNGKDIGVDARIYNIDENLPHGALILGRNGKWMFCGKNRNHLFADSRMDNLVLAINDRDYINNAGYYDLKIVSY
jgi:TPR repeat protein